MVELRDLAVDIAKNLVTGFPGAALREAIEAVTEADGVIAVTPIFTASYSGLFKSFFDCDRQRPRWSESPCCIAATGGTARHSLALDHALRPLFAYLRAIVVPTAVYAASEDWGTGGDGTHRRPPHPDRPRVAENWPVWSTPRPAPPTRPAPHEVVPFEQQLAALRVKEKPAPGDTRPLRRIRATRTPICGPSP